LAPRSKANLRAKAPARQSSEAFTGRFGVSHLARKSARLTEKCQQRCIVLASFLHPAARDGERSKAKNSMIERPPPRESGGRARGGCGPAHSAAARHRRQADRACLASSSISSARALSSCESAAIGTPRDGIATGGGKRRRSRVGAAAETDRNPRSMSRVTTSRTGRPLRAARALSER
jgi:hypothetical protein